MNCWKGITYVVLEGDTGRYVILEAFWTVLQPNVSSLLIEEFDFKMTYELDWFISSNFHYDQK